jgi:predicted nucleic acid-binding Zn ribbon protein
VEKVDKILGQLAQSQRQTTAQPKAVSYDYQRRDSSPSFNRVAAIASSSENSNIKTVSSLQHETSSNNRVEAGNYAPRRRRSGVPTDLTKVKGILSKVLSHRGLDKKVERYEFILHWHEIVGERLAEVSKPECIVNRQLIVNVLHPAWAQELTMIKPVLLESLARFLPPGDTVRDMVFRVRSFAT